MSRAVECISGSLLRVSEYGVIKCLGVDSRPFYRALAGHGRQILRSEIAQLSAIPSHGRTRPAYDGNITRFQHCIPCSENFYYEGQTHECTSGNRTDSNFED